ncbi:MAG: hypothetical protein ACLR23_23375 [Clostridia bacterium]
MDQPGEWYYDADERALYIIPPKGYTGDLYVRYKSQRNGFILNGKSNIRIENLHFFGCGVEMDNATSGCVLNRITAEYAQHSISGEGCMGAQCWGSNEREGLGEVELRCQWAAEIRAAKPVKSHTALAMAYMSAGRAGPNLSITSIHDVDYIGSDACAVHLINARGNV